MKKNSIKSLPVTVMLISVLLCGCSAKNTASSRTEAVTEVKAEDGDTLSNDSCLRFGCTLCHHSLCYCAKHRK